MFVKFIRTVIRSTPKRSLGRKLSQLTNLNHLSEKGIKYQREEEDGDMLSSKAGGFLPQANK
jgi:hypothetical protein